MNNQVLNDDSVSTDQMIGNMDTALNSLEELERAIELKKKSNAMLAKIVEDIGNDKGI